MATLVGVYSGENVPEKPPGCTRFVCISDTHGKQNSMKFPVPEGDVLIHSGDFSEFGREGTQKQPFFLPLFS